MDLEDKIGLDDLMYLAESNKRAALAVFKQDFDWVPFELSSKDNFDESKYTVDVIENKVVIKSYKYFKKFISIFGHLVKDLVIEIDENSRYRLTSVFQLISQLCTSLKELGFVYDEDFGEFEPSVDVATVMCNNPLCINTSMPSVENLVLDNVYVKSEMKLSTWFPNLQSLHLLSAAADDPNCIEAYMPRLTELKITLSDESFEFDGEILQIERENIENMIRLNPQLENVGVDMGIDIPFLEFIRDSLPSLQKLALGSFDFNDYYGAAIVLKNVTALCFDDVITRPPPIATSNLIELELVADENSFALEYVKKQVSLQVLQLQCDYNAVQLLDLISSLPDLKTLYLEIADEISVDDVVRLLSGCECLDDAEISVGIKTTPQDDWRSCLPGTWRIEADNFTSAYSFTKITV